MRLFVVLIAVLLVLSGCSFYRGITGSALNPTDVGYNGGKTLQQNYYDLVNNALDGRFNTTQVWGCGGLTCLATPELTSSSNCNISNNYQITYLDGAAPTATRYEIRSDMFSEGMLVLSVSNSSNQFDWMYNAYQALPKATGSLPCWVSKNIDGTLTCKQSDTAIDGDARICLALFQASNNTQFTSTNRTKYRVAGVTCIQDVYQYDTATVTTINTVSGFNITRLPFSGKNCAANGYTCGGPHIYNGYQGDIIRAFLIAWLQTGNSTYDAAARNFTAAALSVNLNQNPGNNFGVACLSGNYVTTGATLNMTCGVTSDWDDAPRYTFSFCDNLRVVNKTGNLNGVYNNLATYCGNWSISPTFTATSGCVPYAQSGACSAGLDGGVIGNSYSFGLTTYYNMSIARSKLDAIYNNYDWTSYEFEHGATSTCSNGLTFRSSKAAKALAISIGLDEASMGSGGPLPVSPYVDIVGSINFSLVKPLNGTSINDSSTNLSFQVWNMNQTVYTTSPGTFPQIIYNRSFTTNPASDGWTLNSWANDTARGIIYNNVSSGGSAHTQNLTLSRFTLGYKICLNMTIGNITNAKIWFGTDGVSDSGDRVLLERNGVGGTLVNIKHDNSPFSSYSIPINQFNTTCILINKTSNNMTVTTGASSFTDPMVSPANGDYMSLSPGANMTNWWNVSSINVTNLATPYNITTTGTNADTTLNITIWAGNGTLLNTQNSVPNASIVSYNWSNIGNNSNFTWYVTVKTAVATLNVSNLTFQNNYSITAANPPPVITAVSASGTSNSSTTILWTTNILSNSSVNYGTAISLGTRTQFNDANFSHSVLITGLTNNTLYYYNVTSCNPVSGLCQTNGSFNFTTTQNNIPNGATPIITLTSSQIELGTIVNITATSNVSLCIDVNAYGYGKNYTCGSSSQNISLNITAFQTLQLNDTSTSFNFTYGAVTPVNKTVYIKAHGRDTAINLTFFLKGYKTNNTFPTNVRVFLNNTFVRSIGLLLNVTSSQITAFNDSTNNKTVTFPLADTVVVGYLNLPKSATVTTATLNLNGTNNLTYVPSSAQVNLSARAVLGTSSPPNNGVFVEFNYTKPASIGNGNILQTKTLSSAGVDTWTNTTIPSACFNPSGLFLLRIFSSTTWYSSFDCSNATGVNTSWTNIVSFGSTSHCTSAVCGSAGYPGSFSYIYDNDYTTRSVADGAGSWTSISTWGDQSGVIYDFGFWLNIAPINPWLEIGTVTGVRDWNYSGVFNTTVTTNDLSTKINAYLGNCTADATGYCNVPIYLSGSGGIININTISVNFTYNTNPVVINKTIVQTFLGGLNSYTAIPLTFQDDTNGTIELTNISYVYVGGNTTINITAHTFDNSARNTTNLTVVASTWNYTFPSGVTRLEFIPATSTSKNVTPYGQTTTRPIFNITNTGYGWSGFNFSIYVNSTYNCVNLTIAGVSNSTQAVQTNGTWTYFLGNLSPGQTGGLWLFANYACNLSNWTVWRPRLSLRACALNTTCSTDR